MSMNIGVIQDTYFQFRKAQADYNKRGFRMPKNFESHFNSILAKQNQKALIKVTGYFLTKWNKIDPYKYFSCGFELLGKNYSYVKFFDEKVLLLYITRDKNKKREVTLTKKKLVDSAVFIKRYMAKNNIPNITSYINTRESNQNICIGHYFKNKIDANFFVILMRKGLTLTDTERSLIPYVQENYRNILFELDEVKDFVKKLEEKL